MARNHRFKIALLAAAIGSGLGSAALVAQPTDGARPAEAPAQPAGKPVIAVTEQGTDPRPLRYRFSPGSKTEFRIINSMSMEGQQGDLPPMSQTLPTITQGVTVTVKSVQADGSAHVSAVINSVGADNAPGSQPGMEMMLRQQMMPLIGVEATYTLSNRGEVSGLAFTNPAILQGPLGQFAEQFTQNLESAAIVVPEEPVGNNGRWTVTSEPEMFAIKAKQSANFAVKGMTDSTATIDYTMRVTAEPQKIEDPNMPPGVEAHLEGIESSFNGQYTIDLTSPIAKGTVRSTMTIRSMIKDSGQETRMRQTVSSTVAVADPERDDAGDE